ncbi:MAG: hypothetical protein ABH849_00665 [Nanoarchaeota archaeon]
MGKELQKRLDRDFPLIIASASTSLFGFLLYTIFPLGELPTEPLLKIVLVGFCALIYVLIASFVIRSFFRLV